MACHRFVSQLADIHDEVVSMADIHEVVSSEAELDQTQGIEVRRVFRVERESIFAQQNSSQSFEIRLTRDNKNSCIVA